jgi:hypothetical protein
LKGIRMNFRWMSSAAFSRFFILSLSAVLACGAVASAQTAETPLAVHGNVLKLSLVLKPSKPDAMGNIESVDITLRADFVKILAGEPLLALPTVVENVQTIAEDVQSLTASDADGAVPLISHDEPDSENAPPRRVWTPEKAVAGSLTWHYRAMIANGPNPRGAAPPLELRTEQGAFSGDAATFLILPVADTQYDLDLHWDLSELPAGATGMSSWGAGDARSPQPERFADLGELYLFGGQLYRFPQQPTAQGFFSAIQGRPPFDSQALMQWTEGLYAYYFSYFRSPRVLPYAVLLRRNPINAGGGVELGNAFIGTFDEHTTVDELKITLAHEMAHTFLRSLDHSDLEGSWYSEGTAVYYERLLPLRAGKIGPDDFLKDLNTTAARYYTDALLHTPNSEIAKQFWAETRVRVLPYDRGALYFALVDSKERKIAGGKRSLDNLIAAMLKRRRNDLPMDEPAWREILRNEQGQAGLDQLDAMLRGDAMLPPSDAFGPCFRRTSRMLRRYELGFDSRVLIEPTRIVRGLDAGSNAAKAGLRNGDKIVRPVPQDGIQADQNALLHLEIFRGGKQFVLSYLPRGEQVEAYQWERVPGVSDSACALPATTDAASYR